MQLLTIDRELQERIEKNRVPLVPLVKYYLQAEEEIARLQQKILF